MNKFLIPIPNERRGTYRLVTFIISAINFFAFGFVFMHVTDRSTYVTAIIGMVVNAIPAIYYLLNKKHIKTPFTEIFFFISAVIWLLWGNYLLAILMVVFSLFSFFANKKMEIVFSEEGIAYPSFPVKNYAWIEVAQVIWKDDVLTIDLKNNKLMQISIDGDMPTGFDGQQFNEWCKERCELIC